MKKFFALCALLFLTAGAARAQFGVVGGYTYSKAALDKEVLQGKGMNGFHAGIAYKLDLPFVTIQPQLTYEVKGTDVKYDMPGGNVDPSTLANRSGFLEFGVGIQGGVDLLAFRPFVLVQPFVGYDVNPKDVYRLAVGKQEVLAVSEALEAARNRLEYGFGVGAGIELIDHIQLSVQWFMNLGSLYDGEKLDGTSLVDAAVSNAVFANYKKIQNYRGLKVTLGLFF